jgi:hypothetical protein
LVEGDGVRPDYPDLLERHLSDADEAVPDREHGLARDRERGSVQEVVRLRNRARE